MITEKVFSPYEDRKISKDLNNSPIWKNCFKEEELTNEIKSKYQYMFMYIIKFDGLTPMQVNRRKLIRFN